MSDIEPFFEYPNAAVGPRLHPHGHSELLPLDAANARLHLVSWEAERERIDPWCIHNDHGDILFQWPGEFVPSLTDVRETAMRLLGGG